MKELSVKPQDQSDNPIYTSMWQSNFIALAKMFSSVFKEVNILSILTKSNAKKLVTVFKSFTH